MKRLRESRQILVICVLALNIAACARANKIYRDPSAPAATASTPAPNEYDERSLLPEGAHDHSVNQAKVSLALDGVTDQSLAIRLQTAASKDLWGDDLNADGAYNGAGSGNRALLGLAGHSGTPLSAVSGLTFDAKSYLGTEALAALLIVDLECDGAAGSRRVLLADAAALISGSSPVANGYTRFSAGLDEARWTSSASAVVDPDSSAVLVPAAGSAPASLTALKAKYPLACLRNTASGDAGLPKALPTSAILLSLGSPAGSAHVGVFVNRITVGADVYESLQWSEQ